MSHFSPKSLSLYGVAITTVVVLFNVVSAYGENNLKAPPPINGRYRLDTDNLPSCFQSETLELNLQQSGIYLRGQLLPQSVEKASERLIEEAPFLNGQWNNKQINLSGSISQFQECQQETITLQADWQNNNLIGKFKLNSLNEVVNFTAKKEAVEQKATPQH